MNEDATDMETQQLSAGKTVYKNSTVLIPLQAVVDILGMQDVSISG